MTIIEQLLLSVDFMHSKRIIHRDLKLENIMLNSSDENVFDIRVGDFGLSKEVKINELLMS